MGDRRGLQPVAVGHVARVVVLLDDLVVAVDEDDVGLEGARLVVVHRREVAEVGGGEWTYDKGWALLRSHVAMSDEQLRFEYHRYLGWPGQAPSYSIGERLWLSLREETRRREGAAFDLKAFHRRALDIGGVGLDVLRDAILAP